MGITYRLPYPSSFRKKQTPNTLIGETRGLTFKPGFRVLTKYLYIRKIFEHGTRKREGKAFSQIRTYTYNHLPLLSIHSTSSAELFLSNTALRDSYSPTPSPVSGDPPNPGVSGGVTGPSSKPDSGSSLYGDRTPRPLPPTEVRYVPYPSSSSDDMSSSRLACSRSEEMASAPELKAFDATRTYDPATK